MSSEPSPRAAGEGGGRSVGEAVTRREDDHLITGDARYTDDIRSDDQLHLAIHRSQYGHAEVVSIDTSAAEAMDGVVAAYTREDLVESGVATEMPDDEPPFGVTAKRPVLAGGKVRHQGDPIAAVVAEDRYTAADAADRVEVEYERLEAVVDVTGATDESAPTVHDHAEDNVALRWAAGDEEATAEAFDAAANVVEVDLEINQVVAVPMEPRATVADYRASDGKLDVEVSCQNVFQIQDDLSAMLDVPEHSVSVRAPDVGGAFGVKIPTYPGTVLPAYASMQLNRPVKWAATRTESFQASHHSRRHRLTARAAVDEDHRIAAIDVDSTANVGGYVTSGGSFVTSVLVGLRLVGAYDIPTASVSFTGVFTNTTPLSAYRGAGRPEAAYTIERLVNACARELDVDPVEFRRKNFVPADAFPYETAFGDEYDSGDYEKALDRAVDMADYEGFRERQAAAREEGRYLGIGLASYIEVCGGNPEWVQGGRVRVLPSGDVIASSSLVDNGQGHKTSFAQIVAEELGVDYDAVEVVQGDTDVAPEGIGTGGSTAIAMGGNSLKESAARVREQARAIAAHELEAAEEDLTFEEGSFAVAGAPDRSISMAEVAEAAYGPTVPQDLRGLEDTTFFSPEGATTPFGTHVTMVEVDPETGDIDIERHVAVDDVGNQINPMTLEGQIHGGVVQSVGQAYFEDATYDENGNLVAGSLQDYAVPKAFDAPEIEWDSTVTPSPNNPLGVKGVGEAGTIGAMPALVNAVVDAVAPLGVEPDDLDMPLTSETVWKAIQDADG